MIAKQSATRDGRDYLRQPQGTSANRTTSRRPGSKPRRRPRNRPANAAAIRMRSDGASRAPPSRHLTGTDIIMKNFRKTRE
jgi:hypothetical protein